MRLAGALSAALAAGAAAAASLLLGWGYLRSRRPSQACWSLALALFALASAALAAGEGWGWTPGLFRVYYAAGAVLNVPWMGMGAVYLFGPRRLAHLGLLLTLALSLLTLVLAALIPVHLSAEAAPLSSVLKSATVARRLAVVSNAGGTGVALFLLLRAARVLRSKGVMSRMARGALSVAAGMGSAAVGGVMAALEAPGLLAPSLAVGSALMLTGFWLMGPTPRVSRAAPPAPLEGVYGSWR